jgi:AraC family transcriptional regulator, regulatory protein of adaptative response / methylated-DNA-[protein]-cysteine methyltransferase
MAFEGCQTKVTAMNETHSPAPPNAAAAPRRWQAVLRRDQTADGAFVYAVKTTGIYCRPSCPARRPRQENVALFDTCEAARAAGYRACRRCRPDAVDEPHPHTALVTAACRRIEESDEAVGLDALADAAGLSPHHFHRVFKAVTGLTPKAYGDAHRAERLRHTLSTGQASVTAAIHGAGYGSSSRFYERSNDILGMTATSYRNGGQDAEIRFAVGECSLGSFLVARSAKGVCALSLGDDPDVLVRALQDRFPRAELVGGDAEFEVLVARVVGLADNPAAGLGLPLDMRGTAFQQRVWTALQAIPPGHTVSYAELARRIGAPQSARAVARACASNPIALAIPCHRVIRQDGGVSGYRWGVERKRALLKREARGMSLASNVP